MGKTYIAKVHFDTVYFEVYNCDSTEAATKRANELAEDLTGCLRSVEQQMSVSLVEVEPQ